MAAGHEAAAGRVEAARASPLEERRGATARAAAEAPEEAGAPVCADRLPSRSRQRLHRARSSWGQSSTDCTRTCRPAGSSLGRCIGRGTQPRNRKRPPTHARMRSAGRRRRAYVSSGRGRSSRADTRAWAAPAPRRLRRGQKRPGPEPCARGPLHPSRPPPPRRGPSRRRPSRRRRRRPHRRRHRRQRWPCHRRDARMPRRSSQARRRSAGPGSSRAASSHGHMKSCCSRAP